MSDDPGRTCLLRRIHMRKQAERLRLNPAEPSGSGELSRPWFDRLCAWCGKEYNQKDEGTRRDYCSRECLDEVKRVGAEKREVAHREKRRQAGSRRYATRSPKKGAGK